MAVQVKVRGLREFRLAVKAAEDAKPNEMRLGYNEIAGLIVKNAVPLFDSQLVSDPSRLTGTLGGSIRALSTARSGRVAMGTPKQIPYAGWWEFGGPKAPSSAPPNRQFKKDGRTLYPTYVQHAAEVTELMEAVLSRIADLIDKA